LDKFLTHHQWTEAALPAVLEGIRQQKLCTHEGARHPNGNIACALVRYGALHPDEQQVPKKQESTAWASFSGIYRRLHKEK
jgi:hypothetical protein